MALDANGRGGSFLGVWMPSKGINKIIDTGSYKTHLVTIASDGTIWTTGTTAGKHPIDSNIFWHFDQAGNKLGSAVPQQSLADRSHMNDRQNKLVANGSGIAWICPLERRYVQLLNDGAVAADVQIDFPTAGEIDGFALTDSGLAFARGEFAQPPVAKLYQINLTSGLLIEVSQPEPLRLLGGEGNGLVGLVGHRLFQMSVGQ